MAARVSDPMFFAIARSLRDVAAANRVPSPRLLQGCRAALHALDNGATLSTAYLAGREAMIPRKAP